MATSTPTPDATGTLAAPAPGPVPSRGQAAPSRPRHFPCFDGLRAIAALSVLALHSAWQSGFTLHSPLGVYTSRLDIGVSVFFLISGFLLYRPFAASHLSGREAPSAGRFYLRRLLRIIPAYWLALTLLTYVLHVVTLSGWQGAVSHYGFAQIYIPTQIFTGIGPSWSLCTEMSFYLFVPLYAAVVAGGERDPGRMVRRELVGLGTLVAVSFGFRAWALNQPGCTHDCFAHPTLTSTMADWLPSYFDLFALGMLLAVVSSWFVLTDAEPAWARHRAFPWVSWAAAAATFVVVSNLGIDRNVISIIPPGLDIARQTLYGVFAFFLLLPAVFGEQDHGAIRQLLRSWPLASIGVVSYGVYLWHQGWITQWMRWTDTVDLHGSFVALLVPVLALSLFSAAGSYFVVERPLLRLKDHLSWWRRPRAGADLGGRPALHARDA
ncbi:MAG TPA: acyltransferase [Acidimicrobiales bacterium]|nr:acyltransferase [Acidimicrobiales bacterium]